LLALLLCGTVRAQGLSDGMDALEKKYRENRTTIGALFAGEAAFDPKVPQHQEAVDVAAKYVTYRYALMPIDKEPGRLDKYYRDFESDLRNALRFKEKSPELAKAYGAQVLAHAQETLASPATASKPILRINLTRVLARLAELGQPELPDVLVDLLDAKQNDGVRYWALRGLRDFLALPPQNPPVVDPAREEKVVKALLTFLDRKPPQAGSAPADEIEGFRMLRREAVRALAQVRAPALKGGARPALVLARFAGNDERIQPPPRLDERLEAALGLARVRPGKDTPDYQVDYAAQVLGRFLADFGAAANANNEAKFYYEKLRPWRIDGARLTEALTDLKAEVKDKFVGDVAATGLRVAGALTRRNLVEARDLTWFASPDHVATSKELFKGVPDSTVKPAAAEPAEPTAEKPAEKPKEKPDKSEKAAKPGR
jgi:hypothetical protein